VSQLVEIGGIVPMIKELFHAGLLHGDCLTVTGKTLKQNLAQLRPIQKTSKLSRRSNALSRKTATS
jgi:dihydroxy-acid dehydratase